MKKLKIGDKVKVLNTKQVYGYGFQLVGSWSGRAYVAAGSIGTVSVMNVPCPMKNKSFTCVDFPLDTDLFDDRERLLVFESSQHKRKFQTVESGFRSAVFQKEISSI